MLSRIALAALAGAALCQTPPVRAQSRAAGSAPLGSEVASIKASAAGTQGGGIRPSPGGERYLATGVPLKLLIMVAYRVKAEQVTGGPDWVNTDRYDMNAKAERPSSVEDLHKLQNLLAERFRLKLRHDTRELPVYALSVDKAGAKLVPHAAQSAGDPWMDQAIEQIVQVKLSARFVPMDYFAWRLGQLADRPVIDQTNLKGGFDFSLAYTRELPPGIREGTLLNGAPIDTSGPNLFEALREQLGLRLDARKGPVDVLAIEHVEKPVEN